MSADVFRSARCTCAGIGRSRALTALVVLVLLALNVPRSAGADPSVGGSAAWPPLGATVFGTEGVRLRTCPSLDCEVMAVAKLGERLTVTGPTENGFSPVDYGGALGFAYDLFLAKDGQATPSLVEGQAGCNRIALIFNIGIGERPILEILDSLARESVPATVFAMGWWVTEHPDDLRRIAAAGFPIGSHGDHRLELTGLSDVEVLAEVTGSAAAIEAVLGVPPAPWFTPYANEVDDRIRRLVGGLGYMPVGWRVPAADFGPNATAESVYGRVMPNVYDGAIVELHLDGPASETSTAVALPWIVQELRAAGYTFVTVPELATPCATANAA
jgi:peptidoglycan/xylan/chitin deacetylase (PgdA/CDA1 family)